MSLIVGNQYYVITAAQYAELCETYTGGDGLIEDFFEGPYGNYYAPVDSISGEEEGFLLDLEAELMAWSTSTQPGGGM